MLADELADVDVPMFAVLGNHDYHSAQEHAVTKVMEAAGVQVLEGDGVVVDVGGCRLGIAGTKGFGGGFAGACGSEFGEPVMKSFIAYTRHLADRLEAALADLAERLTCGSPSSTTPLPTAPSRANGWRSTPSWGATCWARPSTGRAPTWSSTATPTRAPSGGSTDGGIEVRNVAQPLIGRPYNVYCLASSTREVEAELGGDLAGVAGPRKDGLSQGDRDGRAIRRRRGRSGS